MAFRVTCDECGHVLKGVDDPPCPKCGGTKRTQTIVLAPARWGWEANPPTITKHRKFWKKNWWLIGIWLAVQLAGIFISYFTNAWVSVAVSLVMAIVTTILGFFAVTRAMETETL